MVAQILIHKLIELSLDGPLLIKGHLFYIERYFFVTTCGLTNRAMDLAVYGET